MYKDPNFIPIDLNFKVWKCGLPENTVKLTPRALVTCAGAAIKWASVYERFDRVSVSSCPHLSVSDP
jgi:hypothetical protein